MQTIFVPKQKSLRWKKCKLCMLKKSMLAMIEIDAF